METPKDTYSRNKKVRQERIKKIEDYFIANPEASLTIKDVIEKVFKDDTKPGIANGILISMCVRQPHFIVASKELKLVNGYKRKVLMFRKNDQKSKVLNFFNEYPYSKFNSEQISNIVFNSELNAKEVDDLLLDLAKNYPYALKTRESCSRSSGEIERKNIYWKNQDVRCIDETA